MTEGSVTRTFSASGVGTDSSTFLPLAAKKASTEAATAVATATPIPGRRYGRSIADPISEPIEHSRALGIRVKDFSSDSILQDQIRRAHAASLSDRAGTGLHLHIDRFATRRDRYTVK